VAGVDGLDRVFDVMVSPDGKNVYAGSIDDDAVAVFSRDPVTGRLTFVEVQMNNVGGVSGLNSVVSLTTDSQGEHLYAAAMWSHAVTMFSRDPTTGALTYVESFYDSDLQGTGDVGVGPDDESLYVTSLVGDALLVFDRDQTTGLLSHVESHIDGVAGVTDLTGPVGVVVDPSGGLVMALGTQSNSIAIFHRDAATGQLEFTGAEVDGVNGVDGLADPSEGCVDPLAANVYVAAWDDDAVSVFSLAVFVDGFETGDTTRWSGP
jgi:6-phosphogluconolactonase (cycloisomerase 2 family)